MWLLVFCIGLEVVTVAFGHGRLMDPPGRSSAWRYGYNTPTNYGDNALYCGGFARQQRAGGRCGICGDPYTGSRDNEAGGKYATGIIVRKYKMGQVITTKADITANHLGWIEYRICPNNNYRQEVTQECLDKHVLQRADGRGTKNSGWAPCIVRRNREDGSYTAGFTYRSETPSPVSVVFFGKNRYCARLKSNWTWFWYKVCIGNSWGVDEATGRSCIGCGAQEEFYGCADVAIEGDNNLPLPELPITLPPVTRFTLKPITSANIFEVFTHAKNTLPDGLIFIPVITNNCRALYNWAADPDLDKRCSEDCAVGNCDPRICDCQ